MTRPPRVTALMTMLYSAIWRRRTSSRRCGRWRRAGGEGAAHAPRRRCAAAVRARGARGAREIGRRGADPRAPAVRDRRGDGRRRARRGPRGARHVTPFGTLLRFAKAPRSSSRRCSFVAPLSGHFATLLRETVRTMLADHDVFISDWHNARDVPVADGRFGFDEHVPHVIDFLRAIGPGGHLVAVCQTGGAGARGDRGDGRRRRPVRAAQPDADGRPDRRAGQSHRRQRVRRPSTPLEWFERNLSRHVPLATRARPTPSTRDSSRSGRSSRMNPTAISARSRTCSATDRASDARRRAGRGLLPRVLRRARPDGRVLPRDRAAASSRSSSSRGGAALARRAGRSARDPGTGPAHVEGERDDICGIGQTAAAHDSCTRVPLARRFHLLRPASATTASSAAAAGSATSIPLCATHDRARRRGSPAAHARDRLSRPPSSVAGSSPAAVLAGAAPSARRRRGWPLASRNAS